MVDLRADTASSSDKTEFTETEDQSRTHQLYSGGHTTHDGRWTTPRPDTASPESAVRGRVVNSETSMLIFILHRGSRARAGRNII